MRPVVVRIVHPEPVDVGPLEAALLEARNRNGDRLAELFRRAGATEVRSDRGVNGSWTDRLRGDVQGLGDAGFVFLGDGSIPLGTAADVRSFVEVAASGEPRALANNRYSADIVAIGRPAALADLPDMPSDNALPRWLEEVAGFRIEDLRTRWRLAVDLDATLDVLLIAGLDALPGFELTDLRDTLVALRLVAGDRRGELVVAGRASAATLAWLERRTASRTRALIEERGLRASSRAAVGPLRRNGPAASGDGAGDRAGEASRAVRPPRSILGLALDDRGPEALGSILAELGDAAIVDTRVLLAHRLGPDETAWPGVEDRFASDLLLPDRIRDPWLGAITRSAVAAQIPILLGGHSLVGPGIRLVLGRRR